MLKPLRIIFDSIFHLAFALYLGHGFSDVFLQPFLPDVLARPSFILSTLGFFLVLRWLKTEAPETEVPSVAVQPPLSRRLGVQAFSELTARCALWLRRKSQVAPKLERCVGHKNCRSQEQLR